MTINYKVTILGLEWIEPLVAQINWKLDKIMSTQAELTQQLTDQAAQAAKIGNETRSLLDKIQELLAVIAAGQNVSPELQAAADAVGAQLNIVDALVPDA